MPYDVFGLKEVSMSASTTVTVVPATSTGAPQPAKTTAVVTSATIPPSGVLRFVRLECGALFPA